MELRIYKRATDVSRFVRAVQERGDSEREVLGFLPSCVYSEAAAQGKLYVAATDVAGQEHYAGHVLFGGRFPHLRVFQLYTSPQFRSRQIGRRLLDALFSDAESQYYITISARVAADLPANGFWERMGFRTIRTESGGATTGRQINVRRRELNSPTLFSIPGAPRLAAPATHARVEQPIFALDVNVFLDIIKDRPRGEYAGRLLTASMSGILRLFVAREFVNELSRATQDKEADPAVRLAIALPQFTAVPEPFLSNLKRELAILIFPTRASSGQLRERDQSDLIHLATMIYHAASGFVTSDDSILRKRTELKERYGIEVLGPAELAEIYLPIQWTPTQLIAQSFDGVSIEVSELTETRRAEVELFLLSCSMTKEQVALAIEPGQSACPRHRVFVSLADVVVGFAAWDAARGPQSTVGAWLSVDPTSPAGELACDVLLEAMCRDACANRPVRLILDSGHTSREALEYSKDHGFRVAGAQDGPPKLGKFCIGKVITRRNWEESRALLESSLGFTLPTNPPVYSGPETNIEIDKRDPTLNAIRLREFEARFGPVIMLLPGRKVVVVPIQRSYADQLLSTAHQHSLFPRPEASVLGEKLYISSPRTLSVLEAGAVILFYESIGTDGGRGAIVAAAQITRTAIREKKALDPGTTRRGVLTSGEVLSLSVTENTGLTFFDQLMRLENPISLTRLRALGCADGANFVTARQIDESAALSIIEEGKPSARMS